MILNAQKTSPIPPSSLPMCCCAMCFLAYLLWVHCVWFYQGESRGICWVQTMSGRKSSFLLDSLKSFAVSSQLKSLAMRSFRSQAGKLAINVKAEFILITSAASDSICWCLSCRTCWIWCTDNLVLSQKGLRKMVWCTDVNEMVFSGSVHLRKLNSANKKVY